MPDFLRLKMTSTVAGSDQCSKIGLYFGSLTALFSPARSLFWLLIRHTGSFLVGFKRPGRRQFGFDLLHGGEATYKIGGQGVSDTECSNADGCGSIP